jgi:hypothetical protein
VQFCIRRGFITLHKAVDIAVTDVAFRSLCPGGDDVCPSLAAKDRRGCLCAVYKLPVTKSNLGDFLLSKGVCNEKGHYHITIHHYANRLRYSSAVAS